MTLDQLAFECCRAHPEPWKDYAILKALRPQPKSAKRGCGRKLKIKVKKND